MPRPGGNGIYADHGCEAGYTLTIVDLRLLPTHLSANRISVTFSSFTA